MKVDELATLESACGFPLKKHKAAHPAVDDVAAFYTGFDVYWRDIKASIASPNTQRNYATALRKGLLLPAVKALFPDDAWQAAFDAVDSEVKTLQHQAVEAPPDPLRALHSYLQREVLTRDAEIARLTLALQFRDHEIRVLRSILAPEPPKQA